MGFLLSKADPSDEDEEQKNIRRPADDGEATYRVAAVLFYFFVLVIVGFPVWWYTTRVYRATLPLNEMNAMELTKKTDKKLGVPLNLEYDVLVTFVNPDPKSLNVDIEGEDIERNLRPYLDELSSVANFTVKSQWLYLVQLGNFANYMNVYLIQEDQLPHVINPLENKLWAHLTPRPCINLVLYVSPCHMPLYIVDKMETQVASNAFISPGWGGILIDNPDSKTCENKSQPTYKPDLQRVVSVFLSQIHQLFNIDDISEFEKRKTNEMIDSSKRTLKSLAQLLSEIPSIVINDHVAEKINIAVETVNRAETLLKEGKIAEGLEKAKISYENSEAAFKDPSLLALLYFPDDQKYAVYIPLFLPVMIPVLMSLITVRTWYRNRKKIKIE